ncbi:PDZ domain-containing protein [Gimesia fumaroli]|uniref:PDZ domain (Also known as DHR or GLGF) n=1 Tax=Gimesia fumaroli TaxID=2527976 RepID=A0A518II30_9PLAN|nr:PDZ domain-containing protein [Gimesia fumaroli]QDV52753.1 PDZ domain (Also known as DHR or GLGF) [Gimesia fumaroli]
MKRFTLSLVVLAMVFGTVSLDVQAGGKGRSSSRSGRSSMSRSGFSGSRRNFSSRSTSSRSPQRFQSRSKSTRSPQRTTTRKFSSSQKLNSSTTRPRFSNSTPKPRPTMKPIGNTRPQTKPFTGIRPRPGNGTPKPRPGIKPIDPGIGNGKPGFGGIRPKPGAGAPKPRPRPKPPVGNGPPKPRPPKPNNPNNPKPNPGQGNNGGGHHDGGHHGGGHHGGGHHGHGHHGKPWFHARPNYCWWWFNYCTPLQNCRPVDYQYCNYIYPTCDYVAPSGLVVEDARWYLGMKGMMLPGKGVGVESVEENSPAAAAGLAPGMVITKVNGTAIISNEVLAQVIAESGGVLEMELYEKLDGPLMETTVEMIRLPAASF